MWQINAGQGQIKGQNTAFSHFRLSGQLDGLQRAQTHPKCWQVSTNGTTCIRRPYLTLARPQILSIKSTLCDVIS